MKIAQVMCCILPFEYSKLENDGVFEAQEEDLHQAQEDQAQEKEGQESSAVEIRVFYSGTGVFYHIIRFITFCTSVEDVIFAFMFSRCGLQKVVGGLIS